jgi:hypothetical protein
VAGGDSGFGLHPDWPRIGLGCVVGDIGVRCSCGLSIRRLLVPGTTYCIQELPRPFHDSEIVHQRCQIICPASSGTEALGWSGMMRAV